MVCWKKSHFHLKRAHRISFDDYLKACPNIEDGSGDVDPRYRTGHVAVITELQACNVSEERQLVVVTTHLAWGAHNEDVRLWQLSFLLHELRNFPLDRVIFCGDLNSRCTGEVYDLLSGLFDSVYAGREADTATATNANSEGGIGFAETIDYCWLSQNSALRLRGRLNLPSKASLRKALSAAPEPAPIPTLVATGCWPSDHLPVGAEVVF